MGRALLSEPGLINRIKEDGDAHRVRSGCNHCNKVHADHSQPHTLRRDGLARQTKVVHER